MIRSVRSLGADVIENGWNWLEISPARIEKTCRCSEMSTARWRERSSDERKLTKTNCPGRYESGFERGSSTISVTKSSSLLAAATVYRFRRTSTLWNSER